MSTAIAFDFADKTTEQVALQDVAGLIGAGAYCWLDFDDLHTACTTLAELGVDPTTVDRVIKNQAEGQFQLGRNCIHCTVIETRVAGEELRLCALQVILGQNFLVTVHSHPSKVIERVLETYEEDFLELAESGGFLLFELADHLIAGYRDELLRLSHGVEDIQKRLLGDVGDEILRDVSELTRSLLDYRNAAVTAREVIHELATRRSPYVSPSTQPYLDRQTVSLERLAGDAATERTVLSETLALYMGIVSHELPGRRLWHEFREHAGTGLAVWLCWVLGRHFHRGMSAALELAAAALALTGSALKPVPPAPHPPRRAPL
jgi:magnesium transporter